MIHRFAPRLPALIDDSRKVAREILTRTEHVAAFLAGAPLAGLGTPTSDVDLHVITRHPSNQSAEQQMVGGMRVDVHYWLPDDLRRRVDQCLTYDVSERDFSRLAVVTQSYLDPVIRLMLGETLADDGTIAELTAAADAAADDVCKLAMGVMVVQAENSIEDAKGMLTIGDDAAAAYVTREALLSAASAYLTSLGDVYLGRKWVPVRWLRTAGNRLGATVSDFVLTAGGHCRAETFRRLWLAQDLFLCGIVGDTYPVVCDDDPGPVRRDPYAVPIGTRDAVLLLRPGRKMARLSTEGAVLWGSAHGRSRRDAVGITRDVLATCGADVQTDEIYRYYDSFATVDLLGVDGE